MIKIPFYIFHYLTLFHLIEGRITTARSIQESEKAPSLPTIATSVNKLTRKRIQTLSNKLDPAIYDEFGNNFYEEDNIPWDRILEQTSYAPEHCKLDVDSEISCYLLDEPSVSCEEYMDSIGYDISKECEVQVVYEYFITNVGSETDKITKIKTAINNERPFTFIGGSVSDFKRTLTPDHSVTATQTRSFNFCESYNEDIEFEVGIECAEGDPKMIYSHTNFDSRSPSCNAKLDLSCETSDGGPCLPVLQSPSGVCDFHPYSIDFNFTGGLCAASENHQPYDYRCREKGDVTETSKVFIVVQGNKNRIYFTGYVHKFHVFTAGLGFKVDSSMWIYIYDKHDKGKILQAISLSSSCHSKDMALNDTFGALTIAGFRDDVHNVSSNIFDPPQYKFTYKVANEGRQSINLRNIAFSSDDINDNLFFNIGRGDTNVSPHKSLTRSNILSLNETASSCLEIQARLKYLTLPSHNSKVCFAQARYGSSTYGKGKGKGKGRSPSKSTCVGKGKKGSKSGKGKGSKSIKSSKIAEGKGSKNNKGKGSKSGKDSKGKGSKYDKGKGSKSGKDLKGKGSKYDKGKGSKSGKDLKGKGSKNNKGKGKSGKSTKGKGKGNNFHRKE